MFAQFNREDFPIVKVHMNGKPESDKDFDDFLNEWTKLYDEGILTKEELQKKTAELMS